MSQTATPLTPLTVKLVLKLIAPPSSLTAPLPPHLLSAPLLQRHQFLDLSPDDPASYLSWPSGPGHQDQVLSLLESHADALIADNPNNGCTIRYSSDPESVHAHVHVTGEDQSSHGLRLVFQWSPDDTSWKYHNSTLMPFPPSTYESLDFLQEPQFGADHAGQEDDENDYWSAYGKESDDDQEDFASSKDHSQDQSSEDAYWAQYSAVQGSGDSTKPSPLRRRRKLPHQQDSEHPDNVIVFSHSDLHPQRAPSSKSDPPSPSTLEARLNQISPRSSYAVPALVSDEEEEGITSFADDSTMTETPSPPSALDIESHLEGSVPKSLLLESPTDPRSSDLAADEALQSSIKGVYTLWRAGRVDTDGLRQQFFGMVRSALQ